jgi:hypothetical protein
MPDSSATRWIEDAEARGFAAAMLARGNVRESHSLHLGKTIAQVPSWLRHASAEPRRLPGLGLHPTRLWGTGPA